MIVNTESIKDKKIVVVGAARSGMAAVEFLYKYGAQITVSEQKTEEQMREKVEVLKRYDGIELDFGGHTDKHFTTADCIVLSPGVPVDIAPVLKAKKKGVEVISEVELAFRHTDSKVVGITGSNGKTTTTALTGSMLKSSGIKTSVCGNIGNSFINELIYRPDTEFFVVELSSFQLETIDTFRPVAGVILNITPDHMDRYRNIIEYAKAKFRIFENQKSTDLAVLNSDDPILVDFGRDLISDVKYFSTLKGIENGLYKKNNKIYRAQNGSSDYFCDADILKLRGTHNLMNFMAATILALYAGADRKSIIKAASNFEPLEHRLEYVAEVDGVHYYNDSKATNIDSARKSMSSFGSGLILIMGGKDKGADFRLLRDLLSSKVDLLILTGEAAEKIRKQVGDVVSHVVEKDFDNAVETAINMAKEGDTVLLAPGCASFDQFDNFEERGNRFKELIISKAKSIEING